MMSRNSELGSAKTSKKDEFYTSLYDIEIEMKNYKNFCYDVTRCQALTY